MSSDIYMPTMLSINDWYALLSKINNEMVSLNAEERDWLFARLKSISEIQSSLNELFHKADGEFACAECGGECCGCGRHHVTLTTLLAYLLADEMPPEPDFSKTCPYLGTDGCSFPVARRPYNCITFFCERLENKLEDQDIESLRELDRQLRREYELVADRYPAAGLRGLWISLRQLNGDQVLGPDR